jgi:hypothetical protein
MSTGGYHDIPTPAELRTVAKGLYERGWPPASAAPAPRPVREHELEWARQVLAGWVERHRDAPMVRCGWTGSVLRSHPELESS